MEYTREEVRDRFLKAIYAISEETTDDDIQLLVCTSLSLIDGAVSSYVDGEMSFFPKFYISHVGEDKDLSIGLHSLLLRNDADLKTLLNEKVISQSKYELVDYLRREVVERSISKKEAIRKMLEFFDSNYIICSDPHPDDKDFYKERRKKFYPELTEKVNISGNLAERYSELYIANTK